MVRDKLTVVHRARLVDLVGTAGIVLIEGPAGSGKTMLAEDLLERWSFDLGGAVPQRFHGASRGEPGEFVDPVRPLLLDDAHQLDAAAAASWLATVQHHLGPVVLVGRHLRAFDVLDRRRDVRLIGRDDLAFTATDVAAELGGEAPPTLVADLVSTSAGWAVIVDRAVRRLAADPGWSPSGANGVRVLIRELVDETIGDSRARAPLVLLPLIDDTMVDAEMIGTLPMTRVGRWWAAPPALTAALGDDVALSTADAVSAARRYLAFGEVTAAADLLFDLADPDATLAVFGDAHATVLTSLEPWQLRQLVASVSRTAASAGLFLQASRVAERTDSDAWGEWLVAAADLVNDDALARAIAVDRSRHRLRTGDVVGGRADAEALLPTIAADEPGSLARALMVIGMAEVFECSAASLSSASNRFRQAAALFRRDHDWNARSDALARLGYTALFMSGRPLAGEEAMQDALALLPAGDWLRGYWLTNYSDILEFLGRGVEAEAAVNEAIEIGERLGDDVLIGMGWWQRSWMASHRGDQRAFRHAVEMVERHRGDWLTHVQEVTFLASTAERSLLVGDLTGYHTTIERADAIGAEIGMTEPVRIARVWFDAVWGDTEAAMATLDEMETMPSVVPVNRARRLLLRAVAEMRRGDDVAARRAIDDAFELARQMGVPDLNERLSGPLLEELAPIIGGAHRIEAPAVNLRLLGRFALEHPELGNRTPQPGHPATLVKLLALTGSMSTDGAIDRLWPDADLGTGRSRLRNLLNRIKQQAGALVIRDAETLRLADEVVVDATVFERAATDALAATAEERVGRARHALALYSGDLLPGDTYEDWASGPRERLRRRVVALADVVAADAERRHDLDEAVRWFEVALEIEPLDEQRTVHVCELLQANGQIANASGVARRCVAELADLGLRPSAALEAFVTAPPHR